MNKQEIRKNIRDIKKESPRLLLKGAVAKVCGTVSGLRKGLVAVRDKLKEKYDALSPAGNLVAEIAVEAVDRLRAPVRRSVDAAIAKCVPPKRQHLLEPNLRAFQLGIDA